MENRGNAGKSTSCGKDAQEKSDIKDAERRIWHEEYIIVSSERKQTQRRKRKGQEGKRETLDKTSCHFSFIFTHSSPAQHSQ